MERKGRERGGERGRVREGGEGGGRQREGGGREREGGGREGKREGGGGERGREGNKKRERAKLIILKLVKSFEVYVRILLVFLQRES